jgi:hypothetical protein
MTDDSINHATIEEKQPTDLMWLVSCVLITAIATFLRCVLLTLKPLHHD